MSIFRHLYLIERTKTTREIKSKSSYSRILFTDKYLISKLIERGVPSFRCITVN